MLPSQSANQKCRVRQFGSRCNSPRKSRSLVRVFVNLRWARTTHSDFFNMRFMAQKDATTANPSVNRLHSASACSDLCSAARSSRVGVPGVRGFCRYGDTRFLRTAGSSVTRYRARQACEPPKYANQKYRAQRCCRAAIHQENRGRLSLLSGICVRRALDTLIFITWGLRHKETRQPPTPACIIYEITVRARIHAARCARCRVWVPRVSAALVIYI
jgi:hypothetical protein